ncbi:MAG: cardiolipin synthase [Suipraeoptans sp.]
MKRKLLIVSRITVIAVILIVQIIYRLTLFVNATPGYPLWFWLFVSALGRIAAIYIIAHDSHPSYRIIWLSVVLMVPILGTIAYIRFGNRLGQKTIRKKFRNFRDVLPQESATHIRKIYPDEPKHSGMARYLENQADAAVYGNTSTTYFPSGEELFEAMLDDLKSAKRFIFLEFFIIEEGKMWNAILEILEQKVKAGVEVRVLYDDVGSLLLLPGRYAKSLQKRGIKCIPFNRIYPSISKFMNYRDHRKILVVDGRVAFTGGVNLADEYINEIEKHGHWKDSGIRLEGDAVWSYTSMFLTMWSAANKQDKDISGYRGQSLCSEKDGFVQPFGSSPLDDESSARNAYINMLNQAQSYIYIFTPYLIIDDAMQLALTMATKRGVDVRIVTPGIPDQKIVYRLTRSNYAPLLKQGVKIYEYSPGFIHAKSCICDGEYAMIGTINFDYRSFFLNFECGCMLYGTDCIRTMESDALDVFEKCRVILLEDCRTGLWSGLTDTILRTLAPLF